VRDAYGEDEFVLVSPEDADAMAERVSTDSPLGRAILGHRAGERVRFRGPDGLTSVTVVSMG
jgi:transcription elongation GreA/GreB family factor